MVLPDFADTNPGGLFVDLVWIPGDALEVVNKGGGPVPGGTKNVKLYILTFITLWAYSADDKYFSLFCPENMT